MFRRHRPTAAADAPDPVPTVAAADDDAAGDGPTPDATGTASIDLSGLGVAGITRRRMAGILGALLAAWIVIVFARQVGEASAATARADDVALANATLRLQVSTLERELELIGRQRYIEQQARGHGLGTPREIAFTLAPDAPPLPPDAPGSAAVRVGAERDTVTPVERWLTVLFGPAD